MIFSEIEIMKSKCFEARVLTLFPEMFPGPLSYSLAGKAMENKIWNLNTINIRDYAEDKHGTVDDEPYGVWRMYDHKGNIVSTGFYENGKKTGKWIVNAVDSETKYALYYNEGRRVDAIAFK